MNPRLRSLFEGLVGRNLRVVSMGFSEISGRIEKVSIKPDSCVLVSLKPEPGESRTIHLGTIGTTICSLTSGEVRFGCSLGEGYVAPQI